jgi:hypothetical protein
VSGIRSGVLSSVTVEVWRDFECRATRVRLNRADAVSVPTEYVGAITDCALDADDQLGALELAALGAQVAVDDANRRTREAEASEGRLLARVLAAEQRAEAAEAERDRMRGVIDAASAWSKAWHDAQFDPVSVQNDSEDETSAALYAALDSYRAGRPATSEAERIAAFLDEQGARIVGKSPTHQLIAGALYSFASDIRAGAWRKP